MVVTDTLEGIVDGVLWYHYDLTNDTLYLRLAAERQTSTISEETPEGLLLIRRESDGAPVGLTIVNGEHGIIGFRHGHSSSGSSIMGVVIIGVAAGFSAAADSCAS